MVRYDVVTILLSYREFNCKYSVSNLEGGAIVFLTNLFYFPKN